MHDRLVEVFGRQFGRSEIIEGKMSFRRTGREIERIAFPLSLLRMELWS